MAWSSSLNSWVTFERTLQNATQEQKSTQPTSTENTEITAKLSDTQKHPLGRLKYHPDRLKHYSKHPREEQKKVELDYLNTKVEHTSDTKAVSATMLEILMKSVINTVHCILKPKDR